jgi:hypothetical protein
MPLLRRPTRRARRIATRMPNKATGVTASMEILQIQRVVRHLINGCSIVAIGANFEFDDEDYALIDHDCIDALSHARDRKFQCNPAIIYGVELGLKEGNLLNPGVALERVEIMTVLFGEMPEHGLRLLL